MSKKSRPKPRPIAPPPAAPPEHTAGAHRFRAWITETKQTHAQIAAQLHCAKSYIAMLSTGAAPPSLRLAARIERLVGIPCIAWTEPAPAR